MAVRHMSAIDSEVLTIDATAGGVGLTSPSRDGALEARIPIETAQIRFTIDPLDTVTSSNGEVANPGQTIILESPSDIANFKAIRTGAVSETAYVTYFQ